MPLIGIKQESDINAGVSDRNQRFILTTVRNFHHRVEVASVCRTSASSFQNYIIFFGILSSHSFCSCNNTLRGDLTIHRPKTNAMLSSFKSLNSNQATKQFKQRTLERTFERKLINSILTGYLVPDRLT